MYEMTETPLSQHALDEMSWVDVAAHLARDARLIIPVGALEQHGPHLPIGSGTLIANRIATDLSVMHGVLRAPPVNYGVNYYGGHVHVGRAFAGTATLHRKTLHRALNELLDSWESHGISEFILISAHRHGDHVDAMTTLMTRSARVRVVSIWDVDVTDLLEHQPGPLHAGEAETSLMLHLYPDRVRMDRVRDEPLSTSARAGYRTERLPAPAPSGSGVVGKASAATPQKGQAIYERIIVVIGRSVFSAAETADSDTL